MTNVDVRALAKLARLEVSDEELEKLQKEIPTIVAFVEIIQKASVSDVRAKGQLRNVMRTDADPHESGTYTERLLEEAPVRENDRIAVKQVISRKK